MRSLVLAVAVALATPAAALACGGQPCGEGCSLSAHAAESGDAFAAVEAARGTKVWLEVDGMKCGKCSARVTEALKGLDGVTAVAVSHENGKARVAYDAAKVDVTKLVQAVTALGYSAKKAEQA
jgi:copper chaperone